MTNCPVTAITNKKIRVILFIISLILINNMPGYSQFIIGTFQDPCLSTSTDTTNIEQVKIDSASFKKAKDAYFNLLTGYQEKTNLSTSEAGMDYALYIASKVGLKYLIRDDRFINGAVFNDEAASDIVKHYKALDPERRDALYGYNIIDEPVFKAASNVQKWISYFRKNDPAKLAYINLLPDFGFGSQHEYERYLDTYLYNRSSLKNPLIVSYDHYPFHYKDTRNYFYNLYIIKKKAGDRPFWCHPLSSEHMSYIDPDENYLRFMVFCPIAYGAKGIIYFTYENPGDPDYKTSIMRGCGVEDKYPIIKTINHYVADIIAPVVMNSKNLGAFHKSNSGNPTGEILSKEQMISSRTPLFADIFGHTLMVGIFQDNNNSSTCYGLIVNKGLLKIKNVKIILKGGDYRNKITVSPSAENYTGNSEYTKPDDEEFNPKTNETKIYINALAGGEGRIIKVEGVTNIYN
jgi:hypothetical protein